MHIQYSMSKAQNIKVDVGEPWSDDEGTVYPPTVELRPWAIEGGHYWSFSVAEARAMIEALQRGVDRAEELFPDGQT